MEFPFFIHGCRCALSLFLSLSLSPPPAIGNTQRFSPDGTRAGVGSADASVLLYDVERMRDFDAGAGGAGEPLLQQYRLHKAPVTDIVFHPFDSFVASASRDKTVALCNYRLAQDSRQFHDSKRVISEVSAVRCLAWHPTGDAMLVGTDHAIVRLYDVPTLKCYATRRHGDHHFDVINHMEWAPGASVYATCAKDGSIKIWDGVSSECINTIGQAHTGASVSSVQFSKSGRYLLSVGRDSHARLWDLRKGRQVQQYATPQASVSCPAVFSHYEDFVFAADESKMAVVAFNTRTAERVRTFDSHKAPLRGLAASSTAPEFLTASEDKRSAFWKHSLDEQEAA